MPHHVRDGGVWKQTQSLWVRDGGVWKETQTGYVRDGGVWKQFFTSAPALFPDGGFESWSSGTGGPPDGWQVNNTGDAYMGQSTVSTEGTYAAQINSNTEKAAVTCESTVTYDWSAVSTLYFDITATGSSNNIVIRINGTEYYSAQVAVANDITVDVSAETATASLILELASTSKGETVTVDNVRVQ